MNALPTTTGDIPRISIITTHSIRKKTSQCLQLLYPDAPERPTVSATPHSVVALVAKSAAASKAITIIEIVKRRMAEQGDHYYQYSALSSMTVDIQHVAGSCKNKPDSKRHARNDAEGKRKLGEGKEGFGEEEDEDVFESMEEKAQPVRKKVPLLTIYISKSPLLEFARVYGEQPGDF